MSEKAGRTPQNLADAEDAAQTNRALHENASPSSVATPGPGHNRGPPLDELALSVPEASRLLGLGRNSAYEAAARGELPTIRIGGRVLVPRKALDRLLDTATEAWQRRQEQTVVA